MVAADSLCLPLASGSVDAVICIAVLHHMSTVERRVAVLREIRRVLLSRGRALVTVVSGAWVEGQAGVRLHRLAFGGVMVHRKRGSRVLPSVSRSGRLGKRTWTR